MLLATFLQLCCLQVRYIIVSQPIGREINFPGDNQRDSTIGQEISHGIIMISCRLVCTGVLKE